VRKRLLLSYLSVVFVVLVVLEIPLAILADHHERSSLLNQATSTAQSIAVLAGTDLGARQFDSLQTLVQRYHVQAGGDLLVVSGTGQVVASSDPGSARDLVNVQPLVTTALQGRNATGWKTNDGHEAAVAAVPVHVGASTSAVDGAVVLFLPADPALDRIHGVWLALGIFAAAVLALTALVGSGLARGVTRPLAGLSTAVKRLGSGNLSERAEPAGPAELQALAVEFNRMAARIEQLVTAQTRFDRR
jgi:HAMP domain-containing protein